MTEFSTERLYGGSSPQSKGPDLSPVGMILVPLAAILFQVYLPRFFQYLAISGTAASGDRLLRVDAPAADSRTHFRRTSSDSGRTR